MKNKSTSGVYLDDKKVILTADSGEYYFNEDRAFSIKVKLYDTTTTLTSNQLTYYQQQNRAVAVGDVLIFDGENQIYADTRTF